MRKISIFILLIPSFLIARNFEVNKVINNNVIRILIKTSPFISINHKIEFNKALVFVDGNKIYGVAPGNLPSEQINSIIVKWNSNIFNLPSNLFNDCYNPCFDSSNVRIDIGSNKNQIFFFMNAGDGAGVYSVLWIIDKNSNHNKYAIIGGDCQLFNLFCGEN